MQILLLEDISNTSLESIIHLLYTDREYNFRKP